ncbi:MAG: ABC-F family ATP-binding cassette domain-containing protein [Anaerolineales bacterium]|nr:MAG: ABC-F family ATP-binding cassette domain-containing protein [Anaerolineales bacterium]
MMTDQTWNNTLVSLVGIIVQRPTAWKIAAQDLWDSLGYNPPQDPMSLIQAESLSKSYGIQDVFTGVNLALPRQARVALIGVNGVGKSTLLRLLAGMETPDRGHVQRARNLRIGYLPQESIDSRQDLLTADETLWELALGAFAALGSIESQLAELEAVMADPDQVDRALQQYGELQEVFEREGGYTYQAQARQVLRGLGFEEHDFNRPLQQFSGGEKTRAHLVRLLLDDPELLILDEPTNHLDLEAVEWLENWLRDWPGAALIVSHDRYFLDRVADGIWDLTPTGIEAYRGNYSAYVQEREARREHLAAMVQAQQDHIRKERDFIQRNIAGQNTRQAQGRRKRLERLLRDDHVVMDADARTARIQFKAPKRSGDIVLESKDLVIGYADGDPLFNVPDLVLQRGQRVALIGPNGAGKTTLLKTLLGDHPAKSGSVRLGASVHIGYFAQAHADLNPKNTLEQEILEAAPELRRTELRSLLARFLFASDDLMKPIEVLSGGERARVALLRLILEGANFLLLDEPTNHLDLLAQEALQAALEQFPGTVLLVSHDRYLVRALAGEIWHVDDQAQLLRIYPHGYEDYVQARADRSARERKAEFAPKRKAPPASMIKQAHLPSIEAVEAQIKTLEVELEALNALLLGTQENYQEQSRLGQRYRQLEEELDQQLKLWERVAQSAGPA